MTSRQAKGASLVGKLKAIADEQAARPTAGDAATAPPPLPLSSPVIPNVRSEPRPYTTVSMNVPIDMLAELRDAANRLAVQRARLHPKGRGGRPSVSDLVTEILDAQISYIRGLGK